MKKLTALLLGAVVSISFTASDAFADVNLNPLSLVKSYFKSDDGSTGGFLGVSYNYGDIDDIRASYIRGAGFPNPTGRAKSSWKLDDGEGAQVQFGFDFGKIRLDARVGALYSNVLSIDGDALDPPASNEAVVAYTTFNINLDLYRFHIGDYLKAGWPGTPFNIDIAATPYVGVGMGYGGGWMTGKKRQSGVGGTASSVTEPAGHGYAYSYEAGVLVNITDWAGITVGYNYLDVNLEGYNTSEKSNAQAHLGTVGFRITY